MVGYFYPGDEEKHESVEGPSRVNLSRLCKSSALLSVSPRERAKRRRHMRRPPSELEKKTFNFLPERWSWHCWVGLEMPILVAGPVRRRRVGSGYCGRVIAR